MLKGGDTETIEDLWKAYHQGRAQGDGQVYKNHLIERYRDLVKYAAERLHEKLPDKVELDDLISAGTFGLINAIEAYDPERGVKFETYCAPRIKGSILDELRRMDWAPRLMRARAQQLTKATHTLEMRLGRTPNDEELAEELNMGREEYKRLRRDADAAALFSLENPTSSDEYDGEKTYLVDELDNQRAEDPVLEVQKRDLQELLTKGLARAERLIIALYYYEEMTMEEIGAVLDLSQSRVSQLHASIIARLKVRISPGHLQL